MEEIEMITVDARGLSCPQPALLSKQAISTLERGTIEVLVDSATSRDNVARMAERSGWAVSIQAGAEGGFRLVLER